MKAKPLHLFKKQLFQYVQWGLNTWVLSVLFLIIYFFSLLALKSKKWSYENFLAPWFHFCPSILILLKYFLTHETLVLSPPLTVSTCLYSNMRQASVFTYRAYIFASQWQCMQVSMSWASSSVRNKHGLSRDIGAILDMSRKTKWFLTIGKGEKKACYALNQHD